MATALLGATVAGYRIEAVAGRGGMGIVYRARDTALERLVALKVIAPEHARDRRFRARFMRESRASAGIDHPNVIPVYEAAEDDEGKLYIAMRFVDGPDLGRLLHEGGALAPLPAAEIVAQAASALDAAHARGIVHRDVKPGNVLLTRAVRPHVYLTDFGLVRWEDATTSLTSTEGWLGTPDYAAPEQVDGRRADARTDVYALGCVLFAALAGRPPFAEVPLLRKAAAHLEERPPALREIDPAIPRAFEEVVSRALAKDPAERYQAAGSLGAAALAAARAPRGRARTARTRRLVGRVRRPPAPRTMPTARIVEPAPRRRARLVARVLIAAGTVAGVAAAIVVALGVVALGGAHNRARSHAPHRPAAPTPPPAAEGSAGTVLCSSTRCTQDGRLVQAPIEEGHCSGPGGVGVWSRIDGEGEPLLACVSDSSPPVPAVVTMPNVIRGRLDLTQGYLDGLGVSHATFGGGLLGILDDSSWDVCATSPPAGTTVSPGQQVKLFVDRSC